MTRHDNGNKKSQSSPKDSVDVTCIINLHREGCLAHRTLCSVDRATNHAEKHGVTTETLVVCDFPDDETLSMLKRNWGHLRMVLASFGDLGLSRNYGVQMASGRYIGFVDGDDLISENWLTAAYRFGEKNTSYIMHPERNVVFDQYHCVFRHCNQSSRTFRNGALAFDNLWTALSFAHRSVYETVPYAAHPLNAGFGFEDWHFNCSTIAAGFRHRAVPQTAHFIRAKANASLSKEATKKGAVLQHNPLFDMPSFMSPTPIAVEFEHVP